MYSERSRARGATSSCTPFIDHDPARPSRHCPCSSLTAKVLHNHSGPAMLTRTTPNPKPRSCAL
eukprot:2101382-Rhodomonas_salina.2